MNSTCIYNSNYAFMITSAVMVPGHDIMAGSKKKHNLKNSGIHIGSTSTNAIQAADNSQTVVNGAGSTGIPQLPIIQQTLIHRQLTLEAQAYVKSRK